MKKYFSYHREKGFSWFRLERTGKGFYIKNTRYCLYHSYERNGYRKTYKLGRFIIGPLKRYR